MSPATPPAGDRAPSRVAGFELALLAAIVAWGAFARWDGLTGPFGRGWQWLGAFYGMQARNSLRYGLVETAFAGVVNADVAPREEWSWYLHHPPGTLWSMAGSFALFGESAFASKLPAFLFGLLQIVATWRLARDSLSPRAGLVAALLTAALPAGARFSTHGSELGPAVVALSVAALWLDERARRRDPAAPRSGLVVAAIVAGSLFCWAAFTIAGFIAARDALRRRWRRAALFAALPVALLALQLLHVRLATGTFGGGREGSLLEAFLQSGVKGYRELAANVGPDRVPLRLAAHVVDLFTVPGLALAAAGTLLLFARRRSASLRDAPIVAPCLGALALAVGYSAPFPESTLFHVYWLLTGLPLVALLGGAAAHAVGGGAARAAAAWTIVLGVAMSATVSVRSRQAAERTPDFAELGAALREATAPGTQIWTRDPGSPCNEFHAGRRVRGGIGDREAAGLMGGAAPPALAATAFALLEPPGPALADGPPAAAARLTVYLRAHYPARRWLLPSSGRSLAVYDLAQPLAPR